MRRTLVDLLVDRQRRQQAHRVGAGRVQHQPRSRARAPGGASRSRRRASARARTSGRAAQARARRSPCAPPRGSRASATCRAPRSRRRAITGPPREGRAVVARLEHVRVLRRGHARADRQPAAEALRHRHHVGLHAQLLQAQSVPVRPIPHWISSKISSAPCGRRPRARRAARSGSTGWMPHSPCIGSMRTAAVRSSTARRARRRRRAARPRSPGTSGANGACLVSCGVADSAPMVRPWKPPSSTTKSPPGAAPARELDRALDRLGARVAEEHLAAERQLRQPLGQPHAAARCRRGCPRASSRPACSRTASTTRGWQWPSCATEMPARKSRYSLPSASHSRVPSPRTNSTGLRRVGAHHVVALERLELGSSGPQLGPDALVGEQLEQQRCGWRPSRMWALRHARLERVQAGLELRAHPAADLGQPRAHLVRRRLRDAGGGIAGSARQPSTSVRNTTLKAPSAAATAAAAASAFTL